MLKKSYISGVGSYLPSKVITNDDLAKTIDTSDEWIVKRTGIKQRHVVEDEDCSDLAYNAAKNAIENSGIDINDIDGIVVATATPDYNFPAVATYVAGKLGVECFAYDVAAACAGFVFGLNVADNTIKLGQAKNILVIGVDVFSKILDWNDRNTCVLFGDGAGAVVLSSCDLNDDFGILSTHIYSDGAKADLLKSTNDGVDMDGKAVYKFAVKAMSDSIVTGLKHNGIDKSEVDWVVPHQANLRIIEAVASNLDFDMDKVVVSLENHANTSAATIPLALTKAVNNNQFKSNDTIALTAMGAGFSWGSCILKWK